MLETDQRETAAEDKIVIVCSADAGYVMPLAAMVKSVLVNIRTELGIVLYIIDGGISGQDKEKLLKSWHDTRLMVNFIQLHETISPDLPLWGRIKNSIVYQKMLMTAFIPELFEKAIFLDCDLIVKGDLAELWKTDMGDRSVLAVQDLVIPYVASLYGISAYKELGIPPEAKYFNTGLMVANLSWWRRNNITVKAFNYVQTYRKTIFFFEQEALNAVLSGTWGELDPRWNQIETVSGRSFFRCTHLDDNIYQQITEDPFVVHFAGTFKPWVHHNKRPARELYFHYLDMTEWAGWRPKKTIKSFMLGLYEARLRAFLYPAEKWYMKFLQNKLRETG